MEGAAVLNCGKNALEMAEKCIFQTNANEKRAVVKRLSFNQLLQILSNVQQAIIFRCRNSEIYSPKLPPCLSPRRFPRDDTEPREGPVRSNPEAA